MSSYILLEEDISLYNVKHELQDGSTNIFGNGIGRIDCKSLQFKKNSNVNIFAHGNSIDIKDSSSFLPSDAKESLQNIRMNYIHSLSLCSSQYESSLSPLFTDLNIISNSKATNLVLASC